MTTIRYTVIDDLGVIEEVSVTRDAELSAVAAIVLHLIETRRGAFSIHLDELSDMTRALLDPANHALPGELPRDTEESADSAARRYARALRDIENGLMERGYDVPETLAGLVRTVLTLIDDLRRPVAPVTLNMVNGALNTYLQSKREGEDADRFVARVNHLLREAKVRS